MILGVFDLRLWGDKFLVLGILVFAGEGHYLLTNHKHNIYNIKICQCNQPFNQLDNLTFNFFGIIWKCLLNRLLITLIIMLVKLLCFQYDGPPIAYVL